MPLDDYIPFRDMGPDAAARLLVTLPAEALEDRQNLGPSLRTTLYACRNAKGQVRLSGYAIGPQRPDERLTVDALWIADPDLLDLKVHEQHNADCRCRELWDAVRERYGLDTTFVPDAMGAARQQRIEGPYGTWLWWD